MAQEFRHLFTPIQIRHKTCKNRIVSTSHAPGFMSPDRILEYNRTKAQSGLGLSIVGTIPLEKESSVFGIIAPVRETPKIPYSKNWIGYEMVVDYMLRPVAEAYHENDVICCLQTPFLGKELIGGVVPSDMIGWSPVGLSSTVTMSTWEKPHEMATEEIDEYVKTIAYIATLLEKAGFDGIEMHGGHGYLHQQSWTPMDNKRTDKYGETLAFTIACIEAIRAEVTDDFIIGLRMPWDDFVPTEIGGRGPEGYIEIAKGLDGKVDYFALTEGKFIGHYTFSIPPMWVPLGAWIPGQAELKRVVEKSVVIGTCRIKDPVQAEKILADGLVDMVAMTRALIADPQMPTKAREGRLDEIRPCIACNQGCIDRVMQGIDGMCLQNPHMGREHSIGPTLTPAEVKKKVVVIGGGPAGMEAARVATERGHTVVLFEKKPELGGQVNIMTKVAAREEFGDVVRWRNNELLRLEVKVNLGVEATEEMILAENPDVVIVATGSVPDPPMATGMDEPNVLSVWDALLGTKPVGQRVLVFDAEARHKGVSAAEFLADQGKEVEIVTPWVSVGHLIGYTHWMGLHTRLRQRKIQCTPGYLLGAVQGKSVTLLDAFTQEPVTREVDTVVYSTCNSPEDGLCKSLKGKVKEVFVVGDAWAPRNCMDAIRQAFDVAIYI
jgi:2,4-dienoyl-CoA reductase-like NADH-dependent reductase (Old Yellow Enzyme family)/thioredoxin reductase